MSDRLALRVTAVAYAVLYLFATFLPTLPEGAYDDATVLQLVNDDSSRTTIVVAAYALALAGVAFLCFIALLESRLRQHGGRASSLVLAGGIGYGVMVMMASISFGGVATGIAVGELPRASDAYLVRVLSDQGFGLVLVPGLLAAAAAVAAVSTAGSAILPRWCTRAGLIVAPVLLLGFTWAPQLLVPVWAVMVAFAVRRATGQAGSAYDSSRMSAAA